MSLLCSQSTGWSLQRARLMAVSMDQTRYAPLSCFVCFCCFFFFIRIVVWLIVGHWRIGDKIFHEYSGGEYIFEVQLLFGAMDCFVLFFFCLWLVRVTRSLVLCVCFVDRCLSFCTFSFGHCVVCPSIYGSDYSFGIFKFFFVFLLLYKDTLILLHI